MIIRRRLLSAFSAFGLGGYSNQAMAHAAEPFLGLDQTIVPASNALKVWAAIKAEGKGRPVIVGGLDVLERLEDTYSISEEAPEAISAAAEKLAIPSDLFRWAAGEADAEPEVGDWPQKKFMMAGGVLELTPLNGKPLKDVSILTIPGSDDAEAFARLRWGDWNACPPPEMHMALLRSWRQRFGAELVGLSGDTLTLRVKHRPKTRSEALNLAREAYAYCPDSVDQGLGNLSNLAAAMMADEWWGFWWD